MDWQQLIDEAVDRRIDEAAFPEPDLSARVAAGRSSLRRQRVVAATLACAAAIVLGGAALALPHDTSGSVTPAPATSGPTDLGTPATATATALPPTPPVTIDADGIVTVADGWRVVHRTDDPVARFADGSRPSVSVALDVQRGSAHEWLLLYWDPKNGSTSISADPGEVGVPDFFSWLDLEVALATGDWSSAVVGRASDELAPGPGVTILDQWRAPDLGSLVRVAEVVVAGYQRWLVARPGPAGGMEARVVSFRPGADPHAFIRHVRDEHLLEARR